MPPRSPSPERASAVIVRVQDTILPHASALPGNAGERNPGDDVEPEIDDDLDLPTTGGDDEDEPSGSVDEDDDADAIDESDDGGESPLDDAEASDLDAGEEEIDETDDDDGDEGDVDVGPLDDEVDIGEESELGDEAGNDAASDDDGLDLEERAAADDGGIEGTNEAPEDAVDESALPELDADDDADEGDEDLAEVLLTDAQTTELPPWDAARWTPLEGAGAAMPCSALAIAAGRVAAAGEVLLVVGEGERSARQPSFGAGVVAVAAADDLLLTATARGQLAVSQGAWTEAVAAGSLRAARGPLALAATPGRGWILGGGALHSVTPPDAAIVPARQGGVLAITASGGSTLLIAEGAAGPVIERLRGDDEGRRAVPLRGAVRRLVEGAAKHGTITIVAAAGGRALAVSDGARIAISRDDGATFAIAVFGPILALAFAGDDDDAPLLVLLEGGAVVQSPVNGEPTRVAAIEGVGPAAAIGWDPARECAWIACSAGLMAIGSAPRH
jgi:hypothetical protein